MQLGELGPADVRVKRKRLGRGIGSGLGKTSGKGHKDKKQDLVEVLEEVLKEDKHLYIEDFQKEDLLIFMLKNTQK